MLIVSILVAFWSLQGIGILISKKFFLMSFEMYQSHLYILMAASGRRQKVPQYMSLKTMSHVDEACFHHNILQYV